MDSAKTKAGSRDRGLSLSTPSLRQSSLVPSSDEQQYGRSHGMNRCYSILPILHPGSHASSPCLPHFFRVYWVWEVCLVAIGKEGQGITCTYSPVDHGFMARDPCEDILFSRQKNWESANFAQFPTFSLEAMSQSPSWNLKLCAINWEVGTPIHSFWFTHQTSEICWWYSCRSMMEIEYHHETLKN